MNEVSSNATISKLFTRGRSHLGCSLVLMLQNIFPKGTQSRTISINTQYQVLFRNPRDSLQISILARQRCHVTVKTFSKFTKELPKDLMDTCFVVLLSLVQMKSVIAPMFYQMNIHPLCINFNFNRVLFQDPFKDPLGSVQGIRNLEEDLFLTYKYCRQKYS